MMGSDAMAIKNNRIRQLLGKNRPFDLQNNDLFAGSFFSRFGVSFENRAVKFIKIRDLIYILEYFDSSGINWHVLRGLPSTYDKTSDIIVISSLNKGPKGYLQEFHVFGTTEEGYSVAMIQ